MFLLLEPNLSKNIPMPCRHWMWFRKKRIRNEEPSPSSTQAWRITTKPDVNRPHPTIDRNRLGTFEGTAHVNALGKQFASRHLKT